MKKKEIAIVGGGIGGLVTALLLSKQGEFKISIFEKQDKVGGRMDFVEKNGYKIDKGPTIILLPDMLTSILEEGGIPKERLPLMACNPLYHIHYPDGQVYRKYADIERQVEELNQTFPGEEQGFRRFMEDMSVRFTDGRRSFLERSFTNKLSFFTGKNLSTLLKLKAYQNVRRMTETYFSHPKLVDAYTLQTLYIGGHPNYSPAMYSLVSYSEHAHGIWYLKGGYASLIQILKDELEERGVAIHISSNVEQVNIEQKTCRGITVNGERKHFDKVIMNGDFPMMNHLVDETVQSKRKYTPSSGCMLLYMGLDKVYHDETIHKFFMSENFDKHMEQVFDTQVLPEDPSFYTFHPSIIDETLAPEGKGVLYTLVPVPANAQIDWKKEKHMFVEKIIDEMERRGFPDLRKHIEWMDIRTPEDAKEDGLFEGGSFGIAPTLLQSGVFRPQLKPYAIDELYAVGASIHPGGGVPIVMQGAKLLADHLLKETIDQPLNERGVNV
ncbi:phytoene desaturase family protein [Thalassobacillus hwangdonensis]|uniref:Phytoene desaturase family protein n=1 Tax=Thalassobacillus hwangdonensis TaxID=546108 RepID=A0ABW3L070_9BACI